ncbi:MAG: hypothetical protein WCQ32_01890 [bacterium]
MHKDNYAFSLEEHYMFSWKYGIGNKPSIFVEQPTSIEKDTVLFHFLNGHSSESEFIKKDEILAVGIKEKGVQVKGYGGSYRILNQTLFKKYLQEGVVELKGKYVFAGYIDNTAIARGFLIPFYKKAEEYFFVETTKNKKNIESFKIVELKNYTKDTCVFLESEIEKEVGNIPIFVFKAPEIPEGVAYGSIDDSDFIAKIKTFNQKTKGKRKTLLKSLRSIITK